MSAPPLTAIGELVEPVSSWTPERDDPDGVFTYIDLSAVDQEAKVISGARALACSEAPSRARQLVRAGDVLVSTVRPNLNGVAHVPPEFDGATASTGFCVLRPREGQLDGRYLYHWAKSPRFVSNMVRRATGASYPAVSDRIVCESRLPLPPLPEQQRTAGILDKADELRANRRAALGQLDTLTQSIFLDMFGDPVRNPKGWQRVLFSELLKAIDSGWSPVCLDRPATDDEWGVLKLGAVTWCEYDETENKALPSSLEPRPELEVHPGDLLFARKNTYDLVAACALVRTTRPRLLLPDLVFRFRILPDAPVVNDFLHQLLIYPTKRREVQKLAGGSAGSMPNISKGRLETLPIEVPPMQKQRAFADRLSSISRSKVAQTTSLTKLDGLFAALQCRAFMGEL